jgi:deaminated glutathione amidase
MSETFIAAMVQTRVKLSPDENLKDVTALIREAKGKGASYVQTPEMTNLLAANRDQLFKTIADEENDTSLKSFRGLARELKIYLHIGSMAIKATADRAANRAFLIDPTGEIIARYDKIHMFDVNLANGESYRESNNYQPGDTASLADLPWGRIGLTICYDMRFPSLYRALAESGASFLTMPSAFTKPTGEAHWHVLLRSRAIENGAFVFAAAQGGVHESKRVTYGHSLIIDPWGEILAEGGVDPGVITAEIDPAKVADARGKIPSLQHGRRFSVPEASASHLHLVRSHQ